MSEQLIPTEVESSTMPRRGCRLRGQKPPLKLKGIWSRAGVRGHEIAHKEIAERLIRNSEREGHLMHVAVGSRRYPREGKHAGNIKQPC
jgi:hypothetical protein